MLNNQKTVIVIPARYASTRFPAKLLADLKGKPVIQWVYEKAVGTGADAVWVAADDSRIVDVVEGFGGQAVLTSVEHSSGTDRINEAVDIIFEKDGDFNLIINLQGDEPLIPSAVIDNLIAMMQSDESIEMGTVAVRTSRDEIAGDANRVKAVVAADGRALYFTRSAAPFLREGGTECGMLLHWGIYAYRRDVLARVVSFCESPLEKCEKLEQLRALENGIGINVMITEENSIGIDTPEDLEIVRNIIDKNTV